MLSFAIICLYDYIKHALHWKEYHFIVSKNVFINYWWQNSHNQTLVSITICCKWKPILILPHTHILTSGKANVISPLFQGEAVVQLWNTRLSWSAAGSITLHTGATVILQPGFCPSRKTSQSFLSLASVLGVYRSDPIGLHEPTNLLKSWGSWQVKKCTSVSNSDAHVARERPAPPCRGQRWWMSSKEFLMSGTNADKAVREDAWGGIWRTGGFINKDGFELLAVI